MLGIETKVIWTSVPDPADRILLNRKAAQQSYKQNTHQTCLEFRIWSKLPSLNDGQPSKIDSCLCCAEMQQQRESFPLLGSYCPIKCTRSQVESRLFPRLCAPSVNPSLNR